MSIAISVAMAPTSALRSRPPVPIAWLMPPPARATRQDTSWMPVPEAPIRPMSPRGTTLANASGTPPMIAVPQSGPITRRPRSRASRLSAISSSIGTLSEKIITLRPNASALRASAAAKCPGTEISARLASGILWNAARMVRDAFSNAGAPDISGCSSSRFASASAASAAALSFALSATIRSPGSALAPSGPRMCASRRISLLAGVPMTSPASSTPGSSASCREMRISTMESR